MRSPFKLNHVLTLRQFRASPEICCVQRRLLAQINSPAKLIFVTQRYNIGVNNFQTSLTINALNINDRKRRRG